jgi:hypothetical protein
VVSGAIARFPSKSPKISKKSLTNLTVSVVISHSLKPVKISYANGRVSVRIFYKNNLIRFYLLTLLTLLTLGGCEQMCALHAVVVLWVCLW